LAKLSSLLGFDFHWLPLLNGLAPAKGHRLFLFLITLNVVEVFALKKIPYQFLVSDVSESLIVFNNSLDCRIISGGQSIL
jgi:hypothetical protein